MGVGWSHFASSHVEVRRQLEDAQEMRGLGYSGQGKHPEQVGARDGDSQVDLDDRWARRLVEVGEVLQVHRPRSHRHHRQGPESVLDLGLRRLPAASC